MKMSELKPKGVKATQRRKDAIALRETQLTSGKKRNRGTTKEKKANAYIPLTEKDIKRINKEIEVLKKRIK